MSDLIRDVTHAICTADAVSHFDCCGECADHARQAEAAVRRVLARMNEDVRDHTLWRRSVERMTADFAKRHGIELPEAAPPEPLPAARTPSGHAL